MLCRGAGTRDNGGHGQGTDAAWAAWLGVSSGRGLSQGAHTYCPRTASAKRIKGARSANFKLEKLEPGVRGRRGRKREEAVAEKKEDVRQVVQKDNSHILLNLTQTPTTTPSCWVNVLALTRRRMQTYKGRGQTWVF